MSLKRWNARRDSNEGPIVAALEAVGAAVIRISEPGAPDLLVYFRGDLFLIEIKTASGRATVAQKRRTREGWPIVTARDEGDALAAIGIIYAGKYVPPSGA